MVMAKSSHRFKGVELLRCDGSATTRPVGCWSHVLHAFAVSQLLRVRFEVVLVAPLGVVDRATISDRQGPR